MSCISLGGVAKLQTIVAWKLVMPLDTSGRLHMIQDFT